MTDGERIAQIKITDKLLHEFVVEGYIIGDKYVVKTEKGLPPTAQFASSQFSNGVASLIFEDDSFDVVPPGGLVPVLNVRHVRIERDTET